MAVLSIANLSKTFLDRRGNEVEALSGFDLTVQPGEFITVVGPSGCGKTTMLRIVQGLEDRSGGSIKLDEREITGPGPERGFVFQQYGLLPWMTASQNIAFALDARGVPRNEHEDRIANTLQTVGLSKFRNHYPRQMSGGMQQRVGIARALAIDPDILLLDEPFGALDALTREVLQEEMLTLSETMQKTVLFVTHSIDEAIMLADRVVVMSARPGRIENVIHVDIERPRAGRAEEIRESRKFAEYRRVLWDLLMEKKEAA
ncbi:NitT/TauT family transport system ATP-binding protein [Rhodopseudomonas julia]|uniref:NitT/TauT family transport system ATP-binding protein n=1 Tax=Rhodopseudomonas julia TaxID=200617 RepID=A0ABU0C7E6_9BRAD|nr:ABC transporter ATP-binding protein [Rhodopseudomonas julia]MDQ0325550.1 NitT/TauT family transport system ATP-binding protein [Rhodopseudomonas julia]